MIKPSILKPGCRIGVLSPSYWLKKKDLEKTTKFFQDKGYTMVMGNSNSMKWGPFAGTPQDRADEGAREGHLSEEVVSRLPPALAHILRVAAYLSGGLYRIRRLRRRCSTGRADRARG